MKKGLAIFYNTGECAIATKNAKGGTTYIHFDKVSDMVNHAKAHQYELRGVCTLD